MPSAPKPLEPKNATRWWKRLELAGRRALSSVLGRLLQGRRRPIVAETIRTILVVRLDERVGNLVMLTPVLNTLKRRFPDAKIEVLGQAKGASLLAGHPGVDNFLTFRKQALFAGDGPLRMPLRLRKRRYDLAIDLSNPTDPSLTQALIVALAGARVTLGSAAGGYGGFFSYASEPQGDHEIDLRLSLLEPLSVIDTEWHPSLPPFPRPREDVRKLADPPAPVVVNLGARLSTKQLAIDEYVAIVRAAAGERVVLTWGPNERGLAERVVALCDNAVMAPATDLSELGWLFSRARAVLSCDTGPMHVAVATGVPTLGVFVATDPARFGYARPPHGVVDARAGAGGIEAQVRRWLARPREGLSGTENG